MKRNIDNERNVEELPHCLICGGKIEIIDYDIENGKGSIRELHSKDCTLAVKQSNKMAIFSARAAIEKLKEKEV